MLLNKGSPIEFERLYNPNLSKGSGIVRKLIDNFNCIHITVLNFTYQSVPRDR